MSPVIVYYLWRDLSLKDFKTVPPCSHTHSPFCLILQPNLPQCLMTCFGWSYEDKRYIVPGGWAGGGRASEAGNRLTRCGKEERL